MIGGNASTGTKLNVFNEENAYYMIYRYAVNSVLDDGVSYHVFDVVLAEVEDFF